ncbi:MAG: tRNA uridine-5-carboxymethylaminomethyl(34) synthesis GTPase MnmE [Candidatus Omnitrophica bacterium]|jgi:tRNA modification GTPase|nr:tRNA uridine-5-carboxymethylaminomethyl(34) synthesis GTPase MnmE [Candidatus Omnitrophota bacterium]
MIKIKDYNLADTIAAIATFPSKSALGVIKISGKKSFFIISKIFKPRRRKNLKKVKSYTLHYGWIREILKNKTEKNGKNLLIDEVLVSVMRKPYSYTKEDVIEISSHGGTVVLNKILNIILSQGARLALPGEFTYRALMNGRIDLLQAESISGLVEAKTEQSLYQAISQLKGEASEKIAKIKEEIKEIFIQTEGMMNFPEAEIGIANNHLKARAVSLMKRVGCLSQGAGEAKIMLEGFKCVICGKANVGKSTLFNKLLGQQRTIVSKFPGTTRDVIEESINIKGIPLRIYDTAGILEPKDIITKEAVDKAYNIFQQADLVILMLDGSKPLDRDDFLLLDKTKTKNTILVINKSDLIQRIDLKKTLSLKSPIVQISALKNQGLDKFKKVIYRKIHKGSFNREDIIFLNQYQQEVLKKVEQNLKEVILFLKEGYTLDFINMTLKDCLDNLGKLNGEVFSEEILENIFNNFCIGK